MSNVYLPIPDKRKEYITFEFWNVTNDSNN